MGSVRARRHFHRWGARHRPHTKSSARAGRQPFKGRTAATQDSEGEEGPVQSRHGWRKRSSQANWGWGQKVSEPPGCPRSRVSQVRQTGRELRLQGRCGSAERGFSAQGDSAAWAFGCTTQSPPGSLVS